MSPIDRAALERCIEIVRRDPREAKRIDDRLAEGSDWANVATGCAFHCQMESLSLMPWMSPPMVADVGGSNVDPHAVALLRRLLDAGLSRYEADPVAALERAGQKQLAR
jgi:hypothetical protein